MARIVTVSGRKSSSKTMALAMVPVAVIAIGAACYLILSGRGSEPDVSRPMPPAPVSIVETDKAETNLAKPEVEGSVADGQTTARQESGAKAINPEDDPINPLSGLPQSKHEIWYKEEMERNAHVVEIIEARNPRVHFDNPVENELEAVWSDDVVEIDEVPRIDGFTDEQIVAFLKKPVVYSEDDDEFAVASKQKAEQAKKDALGYIEKGFTINDYLRDAAAARNEANETRRDVREEMERILDNEGEKAAIAYLNEVNPQLEKEGIKPVQKPGRIALIKSRKRLERQQREAEEAFGRK